MYDEIDVVHGKAIKRIGADNNLGSHDYVKQGNLYTTSEVVPANVNMISPAGQCVKWNQVCSPTPVQSGHGLSIQQDGEFIVINGTANANWCDSLFSAPLINKHVYYIRNYIVSGSFTPDNTTPRFSNGYIEGPSINNVANVFRSNYNTNRFGINNNLNCVYNNLKIKPMLIDLTEMFGAGKEPNTVAKFESLFPLDYYAYDTGSLGILTNTSYSTAADFKTAMANVPMYYELATPITYTLDTPISTNYYVNTFGTEQRLPEDTASAVAAPIVLTTRYSMDAVGTLNGLPTGYISEASMDSFLSEFATQIGAAIGKTITATKTFDATTNKYNFTITVTNPS